MKPFASAKPQNISVFRKENSYRKVSNTTTLAFRVQSNIREASGFVITTEPLGFVLTKQVNDFLLRVQEIFANVTDLRKCESRGKSFKGLLQGKKIFGRAFFKRKKFKGRGGGQRGN